MPCAMATLQMCLSYSKKEMGFVLSIQIQARHLLWIFLALVSSYQSMKIYLLACVSYT